MSMHEVALDATPEPKQPTPPTELLDSDVLIDLSRAHPPAVEWLDSLPSLPAVAGFAVLELLTGCRSAVETRRALTLLKPMPVLWLPEAEQATVPDWYAPIVLSHGVGVVDALIGATALSHGLPLLTFNARHFAAVPDLTTREPYTR